VNKNKTKTLATLITQDTVWRQPKQRHWQPWLHKIQGEDKQNKDTGNLDYTRYRMKTNKTKTLATLITQDTGWRQPKQRHWQPWLHKIQGEDKQTKDTDNLDYTRYRVNKNKTKTLVTFITQDTVWRQTKQTLATLITQDTVWRQTKQTLATLITQDTGWRQTKQITQHKQIYNMDLNKTGVNSRAHDWQAVPTSYKTSNMLLIKPSRDGHLYIK
jgi:hypothetical protein